MSVGRETEKQIRDLNKRMDRVEQLVEKVKGRAKDKKKRKPSAYNLFMGDCVKASSEEGAVKDRFRRCVTSWKDLPDAKKNEYQDRAKNQ